MKGDGKIYNTQHKIMLYSSCVVNPVLCKNARPGDVPQIEVPRTAKGSLTTFCTFTPPFSSLLQPLYVSNSVLSPIQSFYLALFPKLLSSALEASPKFPFMFYIFSPILVSVVNQNCCLSHPVLLF